MQLQIVDQKLVLMIQSQKLIKLAHFVLQLTKLPELYFLVKQNLVLNFLSLMDMMLSDFPS